MDISFFTRQLADNAARISALVSGVSLAEARWKPDENSWSILEVVNHLYDEEVEDFQVRLDIILYEPKRAWPPIDPGAWVTERRYNERDLLPSLNSFLDRRQSSLAWLRGLEEPDWKATCRAPWGDEIRAGDMMVSWVTHDQLHMRQLVELHRQLTAEKAQPYHLDYAGDW